MFSDRSFEWREAGIRLNVINLHADYENQYIQEVYRQEYEEYQHPYEDEYSQEVFYED